MVTKNEGRLLSHFRGDQWAFFCDLIEGRGANQIARRRTGGRVIEGGAVEGQAVAFAIRSRIGGTPSPSASRAIR